MADISQFTKEELLDAADMFMENLNSNAEYLAKTSNGYDFAEKYLKAIAYDDFDNVLLYGMANGEQYERPTEWERN